MSIEQEKLIAFENAILEETNQEIEAMEQEIATYEAAEMKKAQEEEYDRFFVLMQAEVQALKAKYKKSITKAELSCKQDLLRFRNHLTDSVFEEARVQILAFTKTSGYVDFLIGQIAAALSAFPCDHAALMLRTEDASLAAAIQTACPAITAVTADKKNRLGGFCLINEEKGLLEDRTFASALEAKKPAFYASCGLTVQF